MNNKKNYLKVLNQLWAENFRVFQYYRRATGAVINPVLKAGLLKFASKSAQFELELSHQIAAHGGKPQFYELKDNTASSPIPLCLTEENSERIIEKSISAENKSIEHYNTALSSINHGPTREILLRHKASIARTIKELQQLLSLGVYPKGDKKNQQG